MGKKFGLHDKLPKKIADAGDSPLDNDKVPDAHDERNEEGDAHTDRANRKGRKV